MMKKSAEKIYGMLKKGRHPLISIGSKRQTKKALLINLLSRTNGIDICRLSKELGWQTHSTRAALSRLRKAGYLIVLSNSGEGKPSLYHITSTPKEEGV